MNEPTSWHHDPNLQGRFHPEHPNDLQVIVHDGGPRLTDARPELMWVHVVGSRSGVYEGKLLNAPQQLQTVELGDTILFLAPLGLEHPFRVTEKYLAERSAWNIAPCGGCGLPELFDAPSDLMRVVFPDLPPGQTVEAFTSFCPLCGEVQVVEQKSSAQQNTATERKWWQVWK